MRKPYETIKANIMYLCNDDVLTESADFTDTTTGDNGVWFPGSSQGGSAWN